MVIQSYYKTITLSLGMMLGVTTVLGMVLASSRVSAEDPSVVDEINITVPVSCTMSGTGMQSHNAEIANGTYTPDIGSTTLHAFCNDNEGFAIYAAGYTGNEVGGESSNKLVGTTASGNATIESGIATTAGNPDVSNWAMKLTMTQDSGDTSTDNAFTIDSAPNVSLPSQAESGATQAPFSNYHVVPNEYTKVAHKNSGTDMAETTGGVKLTTTYAAYISKTQAADTYSGQVKYTLVHPNYADPTSPEPVTCSPYEICFSPNAYNAIGTMGNKSDVEYDYYTDEIEISLLPSNYSRKGYGFAGWNDKYDYSGTTYGPMETFRISMYDEAFNNTGLSFYATWIKSAGSFQNWQGCSSLPAGQVTALTDERDNETYAVAKLADGKCWMIENLRLSDSATLSPQNTNNPSLPLNILNADGSISTANKLSPSNNNPWSLHMYASDNTQTDWALSLLNTNNITNRASSPTSVDYYTSFYSYGNYYNWYSATAANDKNDEKRNNQNTEGDICPTGWRLPIGGDANNISNNDFARLDIALGGTGTESDSSTNPTSSTMVSRYKTYPNNFIYSGEYVNSIDLLGESGSYWTSTTGPQYYTGYSFQISNDFISPATSSGNKGIGESIRCITE